MYKVVVVEPFDLFSPVVENGKIHFNLFCNHQEWIEHSRNL